MISHIPDASDEELVVSARRGDATAFDELVRRYRGAVLAVAEQTTRSRDCAEDVAQDAFLQAFQALPQLQDPQKFGHWLYVIARCRARRVGARNGRCHPTDPAQIESLLHAQGESVPCQPMDELIRAAERHAVRTAFSRLPAEHAAVLRLYYFEDWPVRRIADTLLLPTTTVKWRLHRGRRLLQLLLTRGAQHGMIALEASEQVQDDVLVRIITRNNCLPLERSNASIRSAAQRRLSGSNPIRRVPGPGPTFKASANRLIRRSALRRMSPCGSSSMTPAPTRGCSSLT